MSRGHEKDKDKEDSSLLDVEKLESRISDGGAARKGGAKGPPRPATQETRARNATLTVRTDRARAQGTGVVEGEGVHV